MASYCKINANDIAANKYFHESGNTVATPVWLATSCCFTQIKRTRRKLVRLHTQHKHISRWLSDGAEINSSKLYNGQTSTVAKNSHICVLFPSEFLLAQFVLLLNVPVLLALLALVVAADIWVLCFPSDKQRQFQGCKKSVQSVVTQVTSQNKFLMRNWIKQKALCIGKYTAPIN